jgi:hypothetical protein
LFAAKIEVAINSHFLTAYDKYRKTNISNIDFLRSNTFT